MDTFITCMIATYLNKFASKNPYSFPTKQRTDEFCQKPSQC